LSPSFFPFLRGRNIQRISTSFFLLFFLSSIAIVQDPLHSYCRLLPSFSFLVNRRNFPLSFSPYASAAAWRWQIPLPRTVPTLLSLLSDPRRGQKAFFFYSCLFAFERVQVSSYSRVFIAPGWWLFPPFPLPSPGFFDRLRLFMNLSPFPSFRLCQFFVAKPFVAPPLFFSFFLLKRMRKRRGEVHRCPFLSFISFLFRLFSKQD